MNKILYISFIVILVSGLPALEPIPSLTSPSWLIADYQTGTILASSEADRVLPPASLTKLMTSWLIQEKASNGDFSLDDIITIEEGNSALDRPPGSSLLGLLPGEQYPVRELLTALMCVSGNDTAFVLAELGAGSVDEFVLQMNRKAKELNLLNTSYHDPDGWSEFNTTTARDMLQFTRLYIETFPEALQQFHIRKEMAARSIYWSGENYTIVDRIKQNSNLLIGRTEGVDGLKTGYIDESGFHLVATAVRNKFRLIAIVMGLRNDDYYSGYRQRADECEQLLEWGYRNYESPEYSFAPVYADISWGEKEEIRLIPREGFENYSFLLEKEKKDQLTQLVRIDNLEAPISQGTRCGNIYIYSDTGKILTIPLESDENITRITLWQWMRRQINHIFKF